MSFALTDGRTFYLDAVYEYRHGWVLDRMGGVPVWAKDVKYVNSDGGEETVVFGGAISETRSLDLSSSEFYDIMKLFRIKTFKAGTYYITRGMKPYVAKNNHLWVGITDQHRIVSVSLSGHSVVITEEAQDEVKIVDGTSFLARVIDNAMDVDQADTFKLCMALYRRPRTPKFIRLFDSATKKTSMYQLTYSENDIQTYLDALKKTLEGL